MNREDRLVDTAGKEGGEELRGSTGTSTPPHVEQPARGTLLGSTQRLSSVLCEGLEGLGCGGWEAGSGVKGRSKHFGRLVLPCGRNQHDTVKQL